MKTITWIIRIVLAVGIGTSVTMNLLEMEMNVWLTRGIGCLVAVSMALIIYRYFSGKKDRG